MADMHHKDVAKEIEEMVGRTEPSAVPHSISSNQPNDQMVDDIEIDIKAMLQDSQEPPLPKTYCCIYKVPPLMRELNKDAYTPNIVSIGPYHYGNPKLQNMERYKHVLFKRFVQRVDQESLDDLVNFVKSSEPRVRSCYSDNIKLRKKELVQVIFTDASFIIELFQNFYDCKDLDSLLFQPSLLGYVSFDLLLLEQLPFFLLEGLFDRAFPTHICLGPTLGRPSFLELTFQFFSNMNKQKLAPNPAFTINHFTDLLRTFHFQKQTYVGIEISEMSPILVYSANELLEAGVKFKASTSSCLDLKFSGHVLEIPKIFVAEWTETLFRNMIALEQFHYPLESHITDYVLVLDWLINTSKDVDVLVHHEIITNYIGESNDVAKLFNGLGKYTFQFRFNSDYHKICQELNKFYKNPCNNRKATLRRDYFKTPWKTVASIAGIVLLILTLVQTVFSILQVVL